MIKTTDMASNLAKTAPESKELRTSSTTLTTKVKEQKEPPAGSKIINKTIRVETEQIENGWLITKNYDIEYQEKGSDGTRYAWYSKKWFSKTDPLQVKLNDKGLADEFEAD